jgi:hypothetical protein
VEILIGEKFLHVALLLTPEEDDVGHGLLAGPRPSHWATRQAGEMRKMERSGPREGESLASAQTD